MQNSYVVYLKGPDTTLSPGSKFIVNVFLDANSPVNAFDLEINYSKDTLKSLGFDNTNSIVDIWQASPKILENGNISLIGGILKPETGKGDLIIKLPFEVKDVGVHKISFAKSNIYLADGKGTEIKVPTSSIFISVEKDGEIISVASAPFKSTPSDIVIEQELIVIKKAESGLAPFEIGLFLALIIVVFCIVFVYNKYKRKRAK